LGGSRGKGRPRDGARPSGGVAWLPKRRDRFHERRQRGQQPCPQGRVLRHRERGDHIVTTRIEHPAIIEPCGFLERLGARVTYLPVDGTGRIDPDDLRRAITPRTILVSIMHANNEVGTIQPIEDCARIAHERGVLFHTDAAQSVGKVATEVKELGVDLLSIAGHKAYAPKGVGALFVRDGVSIEPLLHGAGHEHGRRAGTESVLLAAGLGKACELARDLSPMDRVRALRDRFWEALQKQFGNRVRLNGHPTHRLPNTLNVSFVGRIGAEILERLDGVAASTGSACHSGRIELSRFLRPWVSRPRWAWALSASVWGVGRRARTSTSLSND
jgi:cysteine desulfurase